MRVFNTQEDLHQIRLSPEYHVNWHASSDGGRRREPVSGDFDVREERVSLFDSRCLAVYYNLAARVKHLVQRMVLHHDASTRDNG